MISCASCARIGALLLGQDHRDIRLVIAEARIRRRLDLRVHVGEVRERDRGDGQRAVKRRFPCK